MFMAGLNAAIAGWCFLVAGWWVPTVLCWALSLGFWTLPTILETYVMFGGTFRPEE